MGVTLTACIIECDGVVVFVELVIMAAEELLEMNGVQLKLFNRDTESFGIGYTDSEYGGDIFGAGV